MKLARALNIVEGEGRLTLTLGILHFIVAAAHSLFDIGVTALLIARLGPDALPQVYLGSALALMFVGTVIIPAVDRLDRTRLFTAILMFFAAVLVVVPPLASASPSIVYRQLYIACFLMKSLVFLQFWLLAGDLLDIRQAKRLFPVLLGFSLLGGLTASVLTSLRPETVATETLLQAAGFLLAAGVIPVVIIARRFRGKVSSRRETVFRLSDVWTHLRSDVSNVLSTRLLRTLCVSVLLLAFLAQVLDFLMAKAAHSRYSTAFGGPDLEALTSFYAVLNAVIIGSGTFVQLVFANRIISSIGVTRGLLVAPLTFVAGFMVSGAVWLGSGGQISRGFFHAIVGSRAVQKVLRISLVRSSTDIVFNAIPGERRGRAKAFKETMIEPLGVLLGGVFLLVAATLPMRYLLGGSLILSAAFLLLTFQLKDDYVESLLRVLKEKSRFRYAFPSVVMRAAKKSPDAPAADVSDLKRALDDDAASVRLLAVEVAADLKEPEAAALLVERFQAEEDTQVRAGMLSALGKMVTRPGEDPGQESLSDSDPRVRASGMASMAESGIYRPEDLGMKRLPRTTPDPIEASSVDDERDHGEADTRAEEIAPKKRRREHFLDLARAGDHEALERLVHYMEEGDGATRHLAARAFEACGDKAIDILTLALWSADVEGRRYVIRALDRIGSAAARQALLPVLSLEAEEAYYDLVRLVALGQLEPHPALALLQDSIAHRVRRAKRNAHQILRSAFMAEPGMRLILSNLTHPDRYLRSSAIEALEVRVDASLLGGVLPLFEHENPNIIAERGGAHFEFPRREPSEVLVELTRHQSPWLRASAIYAAGQIGDAFYLRPIEQRVDDVYELARLNAIEAMGRIGDQKSAALLESLMREETGKVHDYAALAVAAIRERPAPRA